MNNVYFDSIELRNFKVHQELDFEFKTGFTTITGDNGSGKTTIFDGLYWCLYDCTTKGRKGDSVIRKRSAKNCSGILKFRINEDQYEIQNYRKHFKFDDAKILMKNSIDISRETRDETNKVIENLIMPAEVFLNCLLFSQYLNNSFTELTNAKQKDILDRMLGFDKYDEYYKIASDITKGLLDDRKTLEVGKLPILKVQYNNVISLLEQEKESQTSYEESVIKVKENLVEEIESLKEFIEENKGVIDDIEEIESDLNIVKSKISTLEEKKKNLEASKTKAEKELNDVQTSQRLTATVQQKYDL